MNPPASPNRVKAFFLSDRLILANDYSSVSTLTVHFVLPFILCRFSPAPDDPFLLHINSKSLQIVLRFENSCDPGQLSNLLSSVSAHLNSHCSHCHKQLIPAHCCFCQKCSSIVCEDCGGTLAELERMLNQEGTDDSVEAWEQAGIDVNLFLCSSCFQYVRYYTRPDLTMQEAITQGNGKDHTHFVSPQFPPVLDVTDEVRNALPAGWDVALTREGKRFYFNPVLWLSSWSFPSSSWTNDAPIGYAKYYDENGKEFLYDAKRGVIPTTLQKREFHGVCPCCGYDCRACTRVACPACNSRLVCRIC